MTRRRLVLVTLWLLLAVLVAPADALPLASPASASVQTQQTVTVMAAHDISPDPSSSKDDDLATSRLILNLDPTAVLTLGRPPVPQG